MLRMARKHRFVFDEQRLSQHKLKKVQVQFFSLFWNFEKKIFVLLSLSLFLSQIFAVFVIQFWFCFRFGRLSTWDRNEQCRTLSQAFCDWFVISAGHTAMTGGCNGRYTVSSMKIRHLLNLSGVKLLDWMPQLNKQSQPWIKKKSSTSSLQLTSYFTISIGVAFCQFRK